MVQVESLERRSMLSVVLTSGVIDVVGTSGNDQVFVQLSTTGKIKVTDNGVISKYLATDVQKIKVQTFAGYDLVSVDESINLPTQINTGANGDTVLGGGGVDSVDAGEGLDRVEGRGGNDWLFGNKGMDTILGGVGDDSIFGGNKNDDLTGGSGNDFINGGMGDDTLRGGAGDDRLEEVAGNNSISTGLGNDSVRRGQGTDALKTDSNDRIYDFGDTTFDDHTAPRPNDDGKNDDVLA